MRTERELLTSFAKEMIDDFFYSLNEIEKCTDRDCAVLEDVATDYSMYTTNIHDDDELEQNRNVYYNVRRLRDTLQDVLTTVALMKASEK